ncbi:MAG: hypothetical protein OEW45_17325, partial [Deltaproteobacteria bacterium]|nr:hypothetical protein [Deltaproteobacteria bacterium]
GFKGIVKSPWKPRITTFWKHHFIFSPRRLGISLLLITASRNFKSQSNKTMESSALKKGSQLECGHLQNIEDGLQVRWRSTVIRTWIYWGIH